MVSGYLTSTNFPRVDGLSTDPRDLGCHITSFFFFFTSIKYIIGFMVTNAFDIWSYVQLTLKYFFVQFNIKVCSIA